MSTKSLNLRQRVVDFLRASPEQRFIAREIAQWIFTHYREECDAKKAASTGNYLKTDADMIQQLVAEIGANRPDLQAKYPHIKVTEGRPRQYYWSEKSDSEEVAIAEQTTVVEAVPVVPAEKPANSGRKNQRVAPVANIDTGTGKTKLGEYDLYPKLAEFIHPDLNVYVCRIDEKTSSNKGASGSNEWLHPDLAGIEDLCADWQRELRECVGALPERRARLWSFEVKLLINRSNVRKSYFQTVSNSSWAHFGYLVAGMIEGDGTMKELTMLAATHGIGVIQLDSANPTESQILIPARERSEIDWDMCNRLVEENGDFRNYIERIKHFYQTGKVNQNDWRWDEFEYSKR